MVKYLEDYMFRKIKSYDPKDLRKWQRILNDLKSTKQELKEAMHSKNKNAVIRNTKKLDKLKEQEKQIPEEAYKFLQK
jgi:hypothetical protein